MRYQAFATMLTGNVIWLARVAVDDQANDRRLGDIYQC